MVHLLIQICATVLLLTAASDALTCNFCRAETRVEDEWYYHCTKPKDVSTETCLGDKPTCGSISYSSYNLKPTYLPGQEKFEISTSIDYFTYMGCTPGGDGVFCKVQKQLLAKPPAPNAAYVIAKCTSCIADLCNPDPNSDLANGGVDIKAYNLIIISVFMCVRYFL